MPNVTAPYEILVRFNCEIGEIAGGFRTCCIEQRSFVIDDKGVITGKIDSGASDFPKDVAAAMLVQYLGQQFTQFQDAVTAERTANKAAMDALKSQLSEAQTALAKLNPPVSAPADAKAA